MLCGGVDSKAVRHGEQWQENFFERKFRQERAMTQVDEAEHDIVDLIVLKELVALHRRLTHARGEHEAKGFRLHRQNDLVSGYDLVCLLWRI